MSQNAKKLTAKLKAVPRRRLYEEIVAQIKNLIEDGGLQAGDQLPPERDLAMAFNVSRHSVREAIRSLEKERVLQSRPGSGTYVMLSSSQEIVDYLARAVLLEKDRMAEIFQIREMLEPQVAALAAENASSEDLALLNDLFSRMCSAPTREQIIELDNEFHIVLAKASGNHALSRLIQSLNDLLSQTRLKGLKKTERTQKSLDMHGLILQAVEAGQPRQAEIAMRNHLVSLRDFVLQRESREGGGK